MHEYSIVQSLIESCEAHLKEYEASRVTKLFVKIGIMSGVEPHLLEEAFALFKKGGICDSSEFVMHIQRVKIECQACYGVYELDRNEYICPKCNSVELKVLDGEDMFLMSLEME